MNTTSVKNSKGQKPDPIKLSSSSAAPDVGIEIQETVYHLHASSLRDCSEFFDKSLSSIWWRPENTHSGADGIKYCYKLVLDHENLMMSLVEPVSAVSANTKDDSDVPLPIHGLSTLKKAYKNLFLAFCHKTIHCEDILDFEILVGLADLYCALPAVSDAVELQLLKWLAMGSSSGWRDHALELVALAYKLELEELYHDAFVHLVGTIGDQKHHFWQREESEDLPEAVRSQVMNEFCRISQLKISVDRALIKSGARITWNPDLPDEPKFYGAAVSYFSTLINQALTDAHELLKINLKFGFPIGTRLKYLSCARLPKYPWDDE